MQFRRRWPPRPRSSILFAENGALPSANLASTRQLLKVSCSWRQTRPSPADVRLVPTRASSPGWDPSSALPPRVAGLGKEPRKEAVAR